MNNASIAENFSLLSQLMDIHGENSFKSKTYSIAAYHIGKLSEELTNTPIEDIPALKGLGGASVMAKISEMLKTGRLNLLDEYVANTPAGIMEMLHIKGLGPKKIHLIWKQMQIDNLGDLEYACVENRLSRFKGFGQKTQEKVLESIHFYQQNKGHYLYAQVYTIYPQIEHYLQTIFGKNNIINCGDYRRQMPTLDKLEFVTNHSINFIKEKFNTAYPPELLEETSESVMYKLSNGLRIRVYCVGHQLLQGLFLRSASSIFLEKFFTRYDSIKFDNATFNSEEDIFHSAGIPFIPACMRESASIIECAVNNQLPKLICTGDIKGVIHNHSNWSDGLYPIAKMAEALIEKGFEYLVISDHSQSAAYANGLSPERVKEQHFEIDELNKKLKPFKIFKSIECDILGDGSLDYTDDILQQFDLVIASIHSNLYMNEQKAMMRLTKAIQNPYTTLLGHMTGRLLLSRNGYPVDHKAIIDLCAVNDVVIEINANPHRLDMDWQWIPYAVEKNVLMSINPDAHSINGFDDLQFGVYASQKGGLSNTSNLSSYTLEQFEAFLAARKKKKGI